MNPPLRERLRWAGQEPTPADASADRAVMARSFVYLYGAGSVLAFATLLLPHAERPLGAGSGADRSRWPAWSRS